jgi:dienelactone hydrolase
MNDAAALAIQIERPVIATEDGRSFDGYLARLANGRGPGLVIFSEMWGVAPSKTEMAEDYAKRGWCAYVPNMFWRSEFTGVVPFEEADQAWQRLNVFDWQRAADDARLAVQWLRTQTFSSGRVAAIGFCMGGRTAFLAAARGGVDASISPYALGIAKHLDELRTITTSITASMTSTSQNQRSTRSSPQPRAIATSRCISIPAPSTASLPRVGRRSTPRRWQLPPHISSGCSQR